MKTRKKETTQEVHEEAGQEDHAHRLAVGLWEKLAVEKALPQAFDLHQVLLLELLWHLALLVLKYLQEVGEVEVVVAHQKKELEQEVALAE